MARPGWGQPGSTGGRGHREIGWGGSDRDDSTDEPACPHAGDFDVTPECEAGLLRRGACDSLNGCRVTMAGRLEDQLAFNQIFKCTAGDPQRVCC